MLDLNDNAKRRRKKSARNGAGQRVAKAQPILPASEKPASGVRTLTDELTDRIRADILTGRLSPDLQLRIHKMKTNYKASVGTLREALSRLAADSLVEVHSQRGFRVAAASIVEMTDIFRCLKVIEVEALRQSIETGDDEWEVGVLSAHHRMAKVEARQKKTKNDPALQREWEDLHIAFHQALISACGSPWLLHFCKLLRERALRYRHLADIPQAQHPLLAAHHVPIMEAAVKRDAARATSLLIKHFDQTTDILREAWEATEVRRSRAPGSSPSWPTAVSVQD
jgi:DNA-binding GntR family transcriptional regulator